MAHERGTNGVVGDNDGAVRRTAAHLRTIRRYPSDVTAFGQTGVCQQLAGEEHALAAETRDDDFLLHGVPHKVDILKHALPFHLIRAFACFSALPKGERPYADSAFATLKSPSG